MLCEPDDFSRPRHSQNAPAGALFQWTLLGIAAGVLFLSLVLRVEGPETVVVPLVDQPLPGTCTYKLWLGISCPGCGLTRCFISLAHGDMAGAWRFNPAGMFLFGAVLVQLPYRGWQLWRLRRGLREVSLGRISHIWLVVICIALFAQWLVRILLPSL